jgi:hypothetical protein
MHELDCRTLDERLPKASTVAHGRVVGADQQPMALEFKTLPHGRPKKPAIK